MLTVTFLIHEFILMTLKKIIMHSKKYKRFKKQKYLINLF